MEKSSTFSPIRTLFRSNFFPDPEQTTKIIYLLSTLLFIENRSLIYPTTKKMVMLVLGFSAYIKVGGCCVNYKLLFGT